MACLRTNAVACGMNLPKRIMITNESNNCISRESLTVGGHLIREGILIVAEQRSFLRYSMFFFFAILISTGCQSPHLISRLDQWSIRETVLSLQEEQILDNLVRVKTWRPMIHLDYSDLKGTISDMGQGSAEFSHDGGDVALKDFFKLSATGKRDRVVNIGAKPVLDYDGIYRAYLEFVKNEHLAVSDRCPNQYHVGRWYGTAFYYVPNTEPDKRAFLDLCAKAIMRSSPTKVTRYFTTTITDFGPVTQTEIFPIEPESADEVSNGTREVHANFIYPVTFNDALPNDSGILTSVQGFAGVRFQLRSNPNIPSGEETNTMLLCVPGQDTPGDNQIPQGVIETINGLKNKEVRVELDEYIPGVPYKRSIEAILEDANTEFYLQRVLPRTQ